MRLKKYVIAIILLAISLNFVLPVFADSSDIAGISNNTVYYLKNAKYGNYLYVNHGSSTLGVNVLGSSFSAINAEKWQLIRVSTGNYKIASLVHSDRLLTRNTSNNDNAVIDSTESPNTYQKFSVVRITAGSNAGLYRITNGSTKYLVEESNGNVKFSSSLSGNNYLWSLEKVSKGSVNQFCFNYQDGYSFLNTPTYFDTTGVSTYINSKVLLLGYSSSFSINSNATQAFNYLPSSDVFFFFGHGSNARVYFYNSSSQNNGIIYANSSQGLSSIDKAISNLGSNALANERCILFMGCKTGLSSNGYNLINESFAKGAHFVLGTTKTVYTGDVTKWSKSFFYKASKGFSIEQCIQYANKQCNKLGELYFKGDVYQKLG